MFPGDPGWKSDHGSPVPSDYLSVESYDLDGQPRHGGVGQGVPLDENGQYIYSQAGMTILQYHDAALSSLPSPRQLTSVVPQAVWYYFPSSQLFTNT